MTFQKIKETLVDESKLMTSKELSKFTIKLALTFLGFGAALGLASYAIIGFGVTAVLLLLMILAFNWTFDYISENNDSLKVIKTLTNFWWVSYIILLAVVLVLKLFRFI